MSIATLENLPDDLILDVISHLGTASQLAPLSATSHRIHGLIQQDGWRSFVRRGFPSLRVPPSDNTRWATVADRLTYLDRCWEKRAFVVNSYQELTQGRKARGDSLRKQSVTFHPVLDARQLSSSGDEFVAWGAGEDLVTKHGGTWNGLAGKQSGYSAGFGDVTALSVLDRQSAPELLVGRANGDLQLVDAAGDKLGTLRQVLTPEDELSQAPTNRTSKIRKSPGQIAISWIEWQPETDMVASCKHSSVTLHDLSHSETQKLSPVAHHDFNDDGADGERSFVRNVKFLNKDTVACALGSSRRPLRWGKITPTGLELFGAAENKDALRYLSSVTDISADEKTTVRAIEAVGRGTSESLLLSAWDDGTYRLMDVRTSSPYDAVYRDRWHTYDGGSSLLIYGTQRFVAGSNLSPSIRFFDFRYPKPYHHTDALPCSSEKPQPAPPFSRVEGISNGNALATCDEQQGVTCTWHHYSQQHAYRPDATLIIGNEKHDRVYALAKASDMSDTFYCGLQGTVAEIQLKQAEDVEEQDLNCSAPAGWRASGGRKSTAALIETGEGLCRDSEWMMKEQGVPAIRRQNRQRQPRVPGHQPLQNQSRLDSAYYIS